MRATSTLFYVAALLAVAAPAPAEACSRAPSSYEMIEPDGPLTGVPTEGVLSLAAIRRGDPDYLGGGLDAIVVTDGAGAEVAGTVETVELQRYLGISGYGFAQASVSLLEVWRADAPLEPETTYTAEVSYEPSDGAAPTSFAFDFTTAASPHPEVEAPVLEELNTREKWGVSVDGEYTCAPPPDAGVGACDECQFTDRENVASLAAVPASRNDRYVYRRIVVDAASTIDRSARAWGFESSDSRIPTVPVAYVRDYAEEHCATLETVSLIDGTVAASEPVCVADPRDPSADAGPGGGDAGLGEAGGPGGGGGGCSVTARAPAPAAAALLALALALPRRRRR